MMFLVIFSSLAAAMAIVSQGNLATADAHLKINRAFSAAETGVSFIAYRLTLASQDVQTTDGLIDGNNAPELWDELVAYLLDPVYEHTLVGASHNLQAPYEVDGTLHVGPIAVGPGGAARFRAELTRHPMPGEDYASAYYRQPGFQPLWREHVETATGKSIEAVTDAELAEALESWAMPPTYVRVRVVGLDGPTDKPIKRAIHIDFEIDKKIRFAILSRSRVMVGQNVLIEGPIGSTFMDTDLQHGHPVQLASDFRGLVSELDDDLNVLSDTLAEVVDSDSGAQRDGDQDNRIHVYGPEAAELADDQTNKIDLNEDGVHDDVNADGYIDAFDFFLARFDSDGNQAVSQSELESELGAGVVASQLMELIDTFGHPERYGLSDGVIDTYDRYAKVRGRVLISADLEGWQAGAAQGKYQDFFQGPIVADQGEAPVTFQAGENDVHTFEASDFDTSSFASMASGSLAAQASEQVENADGDADDPQYDNAGVVEEVPFGSAHPYDYYHRPVYRNMTFENVTIPKGANALFENCTFKGVTFVDTAVDNVDEQFNYAGMIQEDGSLKHPDKTAIVDGQDVSDTKTVANNVRFHDCTFEGGVVSEAPQQFTHVRNKIAFTGTTRFNIDDADDLSESEKQLFKRSTLLAPHMSVEMGSFEEPADPGETVELSGTIVAGVMDVRGQARINGTVLTTFEPQAETYPVIGKTSPQFNTTLGYFSSAMGDLEAEMPGGGFGVIQVRYDPTIPLPDGILGPIEVRPNRALYYEVKAD